MTTTNNATYTYTLTGRFVTILTYSLGLFLTAFTYKVWNERQMTHEYSGQRRALERQAAALEALRDAGDRAALAKLLEAAR